MLGCPAVPQGAKGAQMGKSCGDDVWEELDRLLNDLADSSRPSSRKSSVADPESPVRDNSLQPSGLPVRIHCDRQPWGSIRDSSSCEMFAAKFISPQVEGSDAQVDAQSQSADSSLSSGTSTCESQSSGSSSKSTSETGVRKKSKNFIIIDLSNCNEEDQSDRQPWLSQSPIVKSKQVASAGVKPRRFTVEDFQGPTQNTAEHQESARGESFGVQNVRQGVLHMIGESVHVERTQSGSRVLVRSSSLPGTCELPGKKDLASEEDPSPHSCSHRLPHITEELLVQTAQVSNGSDDESNDEKNTKFSSYASQSSTSSSESWSRLRSVSTISSDLY
jgi:hypothetical protein